MRRTLIALALLVLLVPAGAPAERSDARAAVSIFYYPWYGTPRRDGAYAHWNQRGHRPPTEIASAFYPARGAYSSSDRRVLAAHMADIRAAGVDQLVSSWWGRGSPEDARLPAIVSAAKAVGLTVAVHVEPYGGRTPETVAADAAAFQRLGVREIYVYGPQDAAPADWAAALRSLSGVRVFAHTSLAGFARAGGFAGLYTYDVLVNDGRSFGRLCAQARRAGLLCSPSVGPGYDARRAVGDPRVKARRGGRTYDAMWAAALAARADGITVTSYNEWHEGTQIEAARARPGYADYGPAWGARGVAAERAYLDRTAYWSDRFGARRLRP